MASVVIAGDTSGTVTLAAPAVAGTTTLTLPTANGTVITTGSTGGVSQSMLASGVASNGPAFSAYQSSAQTLSSNTMTKIQLQTEEFDTNNCFDNATNYRFTPNVAGYYQVTAHIQPNSTYTAGIVSIYKNGSVLKHGAFNQNSSGVAQGVVTCLVYLNGSTDYVEFYASFVDGQQSSATSIFTWFQGFMARSA